MRSSLDLRGGATQRGARRSGSFIGAVVFLTLVALLLTALPAVTASAATPATSTVSDELMCLCGCNSVLTVCPHEDCGWGIPAKQRISDELATGKQPTAIVDEFVAQYGEQVLASPTKTGFNLLVWVLPIVVFVGGMVGLYFLVSSWTKRRSKSELVPVTTDETSAGRPLSEETVRAMEEELKSFE